MNEQPDHISDSGTRFWFDRLAYQHIDGLIKSILVGVDGKLYSGFYKKGKGIPFSKGIQDIYMEWKNKKAEQFLLESGDEKTSS